jgi:hypothetical protein
MTTDEILNYVYVVHTAVKVESKPDFEKLYLINQLQEDDKIPFIKSLIQCLPNKNFKPSLNKIFKLQNSMRHVTVYTTDKEYSHFVELAKNLHYVKKIETDDEPTKDEIVSNLKRGFKEMQLIKKGKLKTTSLNDFLNEL